jgi:hypothetical protein
MADFYVDSSGSDANPGTALLPWRTSTHANAKIADGTATLGDAIWFQGGQTFDPILIDAPAFADAAGTGMLTLASMGGSRAIFDAGTAQAVQIKDSGHIALMGLELKGAAVSDNGDGTTAFTGEYDNILLDLTSTRDVGSHYKHISIYDCLIHDGHRGIMGRSDGHAIGFDTVTITLCTIYRCVDSGIQMRGSAAGSYVNDGTHDYNGYVAMTGLLDAEHGQGNGAQSLTTHANISIVDCEIYHIYGDHRIIWTTSGDPCKLACLTNDPTVPLVDRCRFHDSATNSNCTTGGPLGCWLYKVFGGFIRFCICYNINGNALGDTGGFDFDGGCRFCVGAFNLSYGCDGPCFEVGNYATSDVEDCTVCFNVSVGDGIKGRGAFRIFGGGHLRTQIYHNTAIEPVGGPCYGMADDANGAYWRNNIGQAAPGQPLFSGHTNGSWFQNNLLWRTDGTFSVTDTGNTYTSLVAWEAAAAANLFGIVGGNINADPLLVGGYPDGTEQLPSEFPGGQIGRGSPAIGAGINLLTVPDGTVAEMPVSAYFYGGAYNPVAPTIGAAAFAGMVARIGSPFIGGNNFASVAVRQLVGGGV